jgi:putative endonuclease
MSRSSRKPEPRNEAERRAARWYRVRGYRILGTNVWCGHYELDVVARRGGVLVFCEVKSKSGGRFGHPAEMVTVEKQRRLRMAGQVWLKRHRECSRLRIRFDVMVERGGRLEHLPDAF